MINKILNRTDCRKAMSSLCINTSPHHPISTSSYRFVRSLCALCTLFLRFSCVQSAYNMHFNSGQTNTKTKRYGKI